MLLGDVALQTAADLAHIWPLEAVCALVWIASKYNEETIVLANFAYSQDPDTFKDYCLRAPSSGCPAV